MTTNGYLHNKSVVCLGILVADLIGRPVRSIPAPGRLALVDEMSLHTGGCACNTGTALARMGIPVEISGKVGSDPLGRFLLTELSQRGIGVGGIRSDSGAGTSASMVIVEPDGERRFIHYIGANARLTLDDIDMDLVESAGFLHIAGALVLPGIDGQPTAALLKRAREAGVVTLMDTVWDATGRWMETLAPCLPHLDYFIPSLPEAQALTGLEDPLQAAEALLDAGPGVVGLKMGEQGCLIASRDTPAFHIPAYQVEVVDATGAGDAFAAGFVAGLWHRWDLAKTARLANAVGALCVTGVGASGNVTTFEETLRFMEAAAVKS
jgi:sugar/nucleoside kinase (ribokinase family)